MMTDPGSIDADTALERVCGPSKTAADFKRHWIPAFAGMTILRVRASRSYAMPNRQSQARTGVPSRLSTAAAIVRQASCNAGRVTMTLVLACACAQAADPDKVLRVEFYVAETGFDPVKVQDYYSHTVNEAIFDSLMTYDYLARPAKLVPRAAESMPVISDQAKTYVFKIRKGIYFAADAAFKGKKRELTAEDYVYSIKRFKDPANKSPFESFIDGIVGLEELKKDAEKSGSMNYDTKVDGLQAEPVPICSGNGSARTRSSSKPTLIFEASYGSPSPAAIRATSRSPRR